MRLLKYFSIIIIFFGVALYIRQAQTSYLMYEGKIFGTTYHIKVRSKKKDNNLHEQIKKELSLINSQMSVFNKDSEISKINRAAAHHPVILSENMGNLLRTAQTIYTQSEGYFDPTVGPLINSWGFGPDKDYETPSSQQIEQILQYVGYDKLKFDKQFKTLTKTDQRISLNLSAIAKGFGVDKIADLLKTKGYNDYIVEIGGEIRASGYRDDTGTPWTLGIREPKENGINALAVDITNYAVATSGNYQNYHTDKDGKRYSHTISPHTGYPVKDSLASVTVFATSCMEADAYATAMMSMGFKKALEFANYYNINAIFFTYEGDSNYRQFYSKQAKELLGV